MESVLKIPFALTSEDAAILDSQSRICNWAYNHLLEVALKERKKFIEEGDKNAGELGSFKKVRNLRQIPAHKIVTDQFDQEIFHRQRQLVNDAYAAMKCSSHYLT